MDNLFVHVANPIPILKIDLEPHEYITTHEANTLRNAELYDCYNMGLSVSYNILDEFSLDRLSLVFDKYVSVYTKNILGISNKFKRTQSWLTVQHDGSEHHKHNHPNAMVAAVMYFDEQLSDNDMVPLEIILPGTNNIFPDFRFLMDLEEDNIYNFTTYRLYPKTNRMFIFPAHLMHQTLASNEKLKRYAVGANYFINDSIKTYSALENMKVNISLD